MRRPYLFATNPPPIVDAASDGVLIVGSTDIDVVCEGHEALKDDHMIVRWRSIASPPTWTPYDTEPQTVPRNRYPMTFAVPAAALKDRPGEGVFEYTVNDDDLSDPLRLEVRSATRLAPAILVEAEADDTLYLADLTGDATLRAENQPELMPPGSAIVFEWEGRDAQGAPVTGSVTGYTNGHDPTDKPLPYGDLERVEDIAVRYRVDTTQARVPATRRATRMETDWRFYRVVPRAITWPAPGVIELTGDTLVPVAARDGATVEILADLVASDEVRIVFGDYTSPPLNGSRPLRHVVPPGEVARHLNSSVVVQYSVIRQGREGESAPLPIHVGGFQQDDPQLPQPRIDIEEGDLIDLRHHDQDPHVVVAPWILMATRQTVWLSIDGLDKNGELVSIRLLVGEPVRDAWLGTGIDVAVPHEKMQALRDRSSIVVTCEVNFRGGDHADAVIFRRRTYTLRTGSGVAPGRAWEADDLEDFVGPLANRWWHALKGWRWDTTGVRLRFMTIRQLSGDLYANRANAGLAPYIEGNAAYSFEGGAKTKIVLDTPAPYVRIGVGPVGPGIPTHLVAYDESGARIDIVERDTPGWVEFKAQANGRTVSRIELWSLGHGIAWFDNILVETGENWSLEPEPVFEDFDHLERGNYGPRLEFATWSINADRVDIEVATAPGGMVGHAIAIHMDPEGHVHQFTPRFAIHPNQSIQLKIRGSAATPHSAVVRVAYFNRDDRTLRAVTRTISVQQGTQLVTFNRPTDLPRENEIVSHISVVHANGSQPVTVFYDDLSLV
ncbi:MAG: hypothetical protein GAK28_01979 [Luteibacter sp.]|uniref:hypothetical protein n=1 Tax=Luteibacter sp. TaxID=1886636 RepID=UPI0013840E45|nr:hypothetical protein [Luteibacter sp.]KAF1007340.1 MAG: hypothetical protein GAK28_01979 [Luteibacter sp.]